MLFFPMTTSKLLHAWKPCSAMEANWKLETLYNQMQCAPPESARRTLPRAEPGFSTVRFTTEGESHHTWLWGWFGSFSFLFLCFIFDKVSLCNPFWSSLYFWDRILLSWPRYHVLLASVSQVPGLQCALIYLTNPWGLVCLKWTVS